MKENQKMGKDTDGANNCLMMVRVMRERGRTMSHMAEAFTFKLMAVDTKAHLSIFYAMAVEFMFQMIANTDMKVHLSMVSKAVMEWK
jgi:hypothetical protein